MAGSCWGAVRNRTFSWQNLRQMGRTSGLSVAENIMTCLVWGVLKKISCT